MEDRDRNILKEIYQEIDHWILYMINRGKAEKIPLSKKWIDTLRTIFDDDSIGFMELSYDAMYRKRKFETWFLTKEEGLIMQEKIEDLLQSGEEPKKRGRPPKQQEPVLSIDERIDRLREELGDLLEEKMKKEMADSDPLAGLIDGFMETFPELGRARIQRILYEYFRMLYV